MLSNANTLRNAQNFFLAPDSMSLKYMSVKANFQFKRCHQFSHETSPKSKQNDYSGIKSGANETYLF